MAYDEDLTRMNQARVGTLGNLMSSGGPLNQDVQNQVTGNYADQRNQQLAAQRQAINNRAGAMGRAPGGAAQWQQSQASMEAGRDISNQRANMSLQAALTNPQYQLQYAQAGLNEDRFAQDLFNQDRAFGLQSLMAQNSLLNSGYGAFNQGMGQLGSLTNAGLGYDQSLLGMLLSQAYNQYAPPQMVPFSPTTSFYQAPQQQSNSFGMEDAFGMALGLGQTAGSMGFKPWS